MANGININKAVNFFLKIKIIKRIPTNISKLPIKLKEEKTESIFHSNLAFRAP